MVVEINALTDLDLTCFDSVCLDLDDTLYDYAPCHYVALKTTLTWLSQAIGVGMPELYQAYETSNQTVKVLLKGTAACHSRLLYFQILIENHYGRTDGRLALGAHEHYWNTFIEAVTLTDGAKVFLSKLSNRAIPVVLVTDMVADIQFRKITKLELVRHIPNLLVVTSEEAGVEKPNPFIFEYALKKIEQHHHIQPKQLLVLGDDPQKDKFEYEGVVCALLKKT